MSDEKPPQDVPGAESATPSPIPPSPAAWPFPDPASLEDWFRYWTDFWQRSVLFLDVLRRRGNAMLEHAERGMPPLLAFDYEVIADARTYDPPANYALLRIVPPADVKINPRKRPVVIVDPRAGHGPGIGGFKRESEVGMALREGHATYFVSFFREPCPGQTIEHVERAEARFVEEVRKRHAECGKPIVYGNCQAGWAVAVLGADRPDVTGPIVINGAPMSYWSGAAGVNPMRTAGAFTGGVWAVRWLSDLGAGRFDGAWLVYNFELLNPANTFWKKPYAVFRDPEGEGPRFLEFERWWTGFYLLNEEEIAWIVRSLFVGNKLEQAELDLGPGRRIDLRRMAEPLVVFASSGDNITPPQQALSWIAEVYPTTENLKRHGQRIVYLLHPHVGHLGVFVSASVARREHRAIIEHIERMRKLEPGLYEMKIVRETGEPDPAKDQFEVAFEERDVEAVRCAYDRRDFEQTEAGSTQLETAYLEQVRPWLRQCVTPEVAEAIRMAHPDRFLRLIWSDRLNPWMLAVRDLAEAVRASRVTTDADSPLRQAEEEVSERIAAAWDAWREARDFWYETLFQMIVP